MFIINGEKKFLRIIVSNDDMSENIYPINDALADKKLENKVMVIPSSTKEENALAILKAYVSGARPILYDKENLSLDEKISSLDTTLFDNVDFSAMFFTSGTTGTPTGAFKNNHNIETDIAALVRLFGVFEPIKIVATVPFIHIYGFLAGLLLPFKLNVDLVFKEHFLPHDLLCFAKPKHIMVTTPLYIKSLLMLDESKDLSETLFISSTGPLSAQIAKEFIDKFNTTLIQLFGSTETGSIAYKKQDDIAWTPLHGVETTLNDEGLLHIKSPFVSQTLWNETFIQTQGEIQTFDYANIENGTFNLIGRSSQIIKVAGKRYSTTQIEEILEAMEGIEKALVHVKHQSKALKDEIVVIFIEASKPITVKEIKLAIKSRVGKINFPIELKVVEKISTTLMGKKCMPICPVN